MTEAQNLWNYEARGPDVWSELVPQCGGSAQSPINIRTPCLVYKTFPTFDFSESYNTTEKFLVQNNGHSITVTPFNQSGSLVLSGGGLKGFYQFVNFHVHWGENHASGSEHQV